VAIGWREAVVVAIVIPVTILLTLFAARIMGYTLNRVSLFALIFSIGILVDDAIVVVENVERLISEGMHPKEATKLAMTQVGSALIATTLVLVAVFVPTAFIGGISGQFYRQFAITIAVATCFSTFVSLTLTPAMCGLLLRARDADPGMVTRVMNRLFWWLFVPFNWLFDGASRFYGAIVAGIVRRGLVMLVIYAALLVATRYSFDLVPTGFIPEQDQGYLIVAAQLPDGASACAVTR